MKQALITGNITRDAVQRKTGGGDSVTSFSVAVNDRRTKEAVFFDCSYWGARGVAVAQYLTKGTTVSVVGELGRREHDGKTHITVNVSDLTLAGGGQRQQQSRQPDDGDSDSYGNRFSRDLSDEVPF